ncbi:putative DNA-directed RNA polymerase II subunit RPB1 [Iris pallida]|uniref:DNA-directed RNA polymerase II subunit RPB1 n=1 Tax=Iris pallida TaxID=29817 RepID=A0AAX6HGN6_IRIPA|nr:putative DNA-directed RNA polymerase II subunit RPB1 [Iris pallida]
MVVLGLTTLRLRTRGRPSGLRASRICFSIQHRAELIEGMFPAVAAKLIRDSINDQKDRDRAGKPIQGWITPDQWNTMKARFEDPKYKEKSEKAKAARQHASKWCGGSIPMTEHFVVW